MDEELYSALTYNPRLAAQGERRRERNEAIGDPSDIAEIIAGFHPVIGPALSAKDFKNAYEEDDKLGMGLSALGMLPVVGGVVKPAASAAKRIANTGYEVFKEMPGVKKLFATGRVPDNPSLYAHLDDNSTIAYREPSNRPGTGHKMQPKSGKTVFVEDIENLMRGFKNEYIHTEIVPTKNRTLQLIAKEPGQSMFFGGFKKGQVLTEVPFEVTPKAGLHPVEFNAYMVDGVDPRISPIGSSGRGVHFGSQIIEIAPDNLYAQGGAIKMPDSYSNGSWKLI